MEMVRSSETAFGWGCLSALRRASWALQGSVAKDYAEPTEEYWLKVSLPDSQMPFAKNFDINAYNSQF